MQELKGGKGSLELSLKKNGAFLSKPPWHLFYIFKPGSPRNVPIMCHLSYLIPLIMSLSDEVPVKTLLFKLLSSLQFSLALDNISYTHIEISSLTIQRVLSSSSSTKEEDREAKFRLS